jgi:aminoglycoside 6'-N-acetyltransferase
MRELSFRRLQREDLPLVHEWLQRPHVARWWNQRTLEEVTAHYLPAIEGKEPSDHFVLELDGNAVGFIQTYLVSDYPEWDAIVQVGAGVAGVDLFIADPGLIGKGLGTEVLTRFVAEVIFAAPATTACVADVDVDNAGSLRVFGKAGFTPVGEIVDPESGRPHTVMRRDR